MSVLILPNGDAVRADQISSIVSKDGDCSQGARVEIELVNSRRHTVPCETSDEAVGERDELVYQWIEALKES